MLGPRAGRRLCLVLGLLLAWAALASASRTMVTLTVALGDTQAPVLPDTFRQKLLNQFPEFNATNPAFRWEPPVDLGRRFEINEKTQTYAIQVIFSRHGEYSADAMARMLLRADRRALEDSLGISILGMKASDPNKKDVSYGVTVFFTLVLIGVAFVLWMAYMRVDAPNTFFKYFPCCEGTRICFDTDHAKK